MCHVTLSCTGYTARLWVGVKLQPSVHDAAISAPSIKTIRRLDSCFKNPSVSEAFPYHARRLRHVGKDERPNAHR